MELGQYFPFWQQLEPSQQQQLAQGAREYFAPAGTVLHNGNEDCIGLLLVLQGQLRVYALSAEGKEVTLFRLLERDLCLFSASCMLHSIQFEVVVAAAEDTRLIQISADRYQQVMQQSAPVANYTNEVLASRLSDVMWLLDQILSKRMDGRVAALLLEESQLRDTLELKVTHEQLARHLGSAREVVTRVLKYLQQEGMIALFRGGVQILQPQALEDLAADSLR